MGRSTSDSKLRTTRTLEVLLLFLMYIRRSGHPNRSLARSEGWLETVTSSDPVVTGSPTSHLASDGSQHQSMLAVQKHSVCSWYVMVCQDVDYAFVAGVSMPVWGSI